MRASHRDDLLRLTGDADAVMLGAAGSGGSRGAGGGGATCGDDASDTPRSSGGGRGMRRSDSEAIPGSVRDIARSMSSSLDLLQQQQQQLAALRTRRSSDAAAGGLLGGGGGGTPRSARAAAADGQQRSAGGALSLGHGSMAGQHAAQHRLADAVRAADDTGAALAAADAAAALLEVTGEQRAAYMTAFFEQHHPHLARVVEDSSTAGSAVPLAHIGSSGESSLPSAHEQQQQQQQQAAALRRAPPVPICPLNPSDPSAQ